MVVEEEGGDTGFVLTVDKSPVDGCCTTVLWQQGGMEVEGAQRGHRPYAFGEHAEGYDDKEVGMPRLKVGKELGVAQTLGLQKGQPVVEGILFDRGTGEFETATCWAVGDGDDSDDVVARLSDGVEGGNGKVGGTHENEVHILRMWECVIVLMWECGS